MRLVSTRLCHLHPLHTCRSTRDGLTSVPFARLHTSVQHDLTDPAEPYSDIRISRRDKSSGARGHSAKYAPRNIPEAQCAFKGLMIHEVMQFALRIAFRCVLHRCGSLDIHR